MEYQIEIVKTPKDRKNFVLLPFEIYRDSAYWVPPLISDELKSIDPNKNPAFDFCEAQFWLLKKGEKNIGRIGAIINHSYNNVKNIKYGRFTRFECINDQDAANLLLKTAEEWSKCKGMENIHGPLGFTNLDLQGLLIDGFDYIASIASVYHLPYYRQIIENYGFTKENDWLEFRLKIGEQAIQKAERGAELVKKRYGIRVLSFKKKSELLPYGRLIFEILNDAFEILPYVTPFSNEMISYYSKKYLDFLNPEFVKIALFDNKPIGFLIGMPSLSYALQKANGKIFPFGLIPILKAKNGKTDAMDQMLTGVLKEYQHTGAAVLLMSEIQKVMEKHGISFIETTGIFESNEKAISNWKNYDYLQHKRRRCFVKKID